LHILCAVGLGALVSSDAFAESSLSIDGTEFVLVAPDGQTRRGLELAGASLTVDTDGKRTDITIASVENDTTAVGGRVVLYRFVTKNKGHDDTDLCAPDAEGKSWGFPIPDGRGGFELTCTSGAIGKCVRWGYRFWEQKPDGPPLRALHAACVRMVRGDYGGDNRPTTKDGTLVYVCDRFNVRACDKNPPLAFEAAWGANGATCVARPRITKNVSLAQLRKRYPRLKSHTGPRLCTQDIASRDRATLLFNRSALDSAK
jgi:hypothetical protein